MAIEDPDLAEVYGPLTVRGADDGNSLRPPAGATWFDIGLVRGNDGVGIISVTVTAGRRLIVVLTDGTVIDAGSVGSGGGGGGDGVSVTSVVVNDSGHLIVTLSSGEELDAGYVVGPRGDDGESAYQIAVDEGFIGTEQEWLDSLKGADGIDGATVHRTEVTVPVGWTDSTTILVPGMVGLNTVAPATAAASAAWVAGGWWFSSTVDGQITVEGTAPAEPEDVLVEWWS